MVGLLRACTHRTNAWAMKSTKQGNCELRRAYPYERVRTISSGICYPATLVLRCSLLRRTFVLPKVRGVCNPEQSRCITALSILVDGLECFYTAVQVLKFRFRFELRVRKSLSIHRNPLCRMDSVCPQLGRRMGQPPGTKRTTLSA